MLPITLPLLNVPAGFEYDDRPMSAESSTTAFNTGIDHRDRILGERVCVVCGVCGPGLDHCHIVPQSEPDVWADLRRRGWLPLAAKERGEHEPRNGFLLCAYHHKLFDEFIFYIRYIPESKQFVFVNHSGHRSSVPHHGKAVALQANDARAVFPSLFIIHEMRVRGRHPFSNVQLPASTSFPMQDWINQQGAFDYAQKKFKKDQDPVKARSPPSPMQMTSLPAMPGIDDDTIAKILAATQAMPSWRACEMEGTSWEGTAEENIQRYKDLGVMMQPEDEQGDGEVDHSGVEGA